MKNEFLYTSGEFAKLNGINKRTLHYYNDIGLLKPSFIDENGYHYYSSLKSIDLETIVMLKRIGLTLDEIRLYLLEKDNLKMKEILENKQSLIEEQIEHLNTAKLFLDRKIQQLTTGSSCNLNEITRVTLPKIYLLYSDRITGKYDEADFKIAANFALRLKRLFGIYDNFGSCIEVTHLYANRYDDYYAFFTYGNKDNYDQIIEAKSYLQLIHKGPWNQLYKSYEKLKDYASSHNLTLDGKAYELGINEIFLKNENEYCTLIRVAICENK